MASEVFMKNTVQTNTIIMHNNQCEVFPKDFLERGEGECLADQRGLWKLTGKCVWLLRMERRSQVLKNVHEWKSWHGVPMPCLMGRGPGFQMDIHRSTLWIFGAGYLGNPRPATAGFFFFRCFKKTLYWRRSNLLQNLVEPCAEPWRTFSGSS